VDAIFLGMESMDDHSKQIEVQSTRVFLVLSTRISHRDEMIEIHR
jgi:hypothetical protein